MKTKLKHIANITTGVTFRSRIESNPSGTTKLVQMKDLTEQNSVSLDTTVTIDTPKLKESQLLKKGDLIFRSRGVNNTAAIIDTSPNRAILAAPLFRIRIKADTILPQYLLWWINQPQSQNFISSRSKGSALKMVSKQGLEDLEVYLPPIERQETIAELHYLSQKEIGILNKLSEQKKALMQGILMQGALRSR